MKVNKIHLVLVLVLAFSAMFSSCKKSNGEKSYRFNISAVDEMVLAQHTIVQLAGTYVKAINDSSLLTDHFGPIDEGNVYLTEDAGGAFIEVKYGDWGVPDTYLRYRKGTMSIQVDGLLNTLSSKVTCTFDQFYFDDQAFSCGSFVITKTSSLAGSGTYHCEISDLVLLSLDATKHLTAQAAFDITWQGSGSGPFYKPGDLFYVKGTSEAMTAYFFDIKASVAQDLVFKTDCPYFQAGKVDVRFNNLVPDTGMYFFNAPSECTNQIYMEFDEMPFTNDMDFYIDIPVIP